MTIQQHGVKVRDSSPMLVPVPPIQRLLLVVLLAAAFAVSAGLTTLVLTPDSAGAPATSQLVDDVEAGGLTE